MTIDGERLSILMTSVLYYNASIFSIGSVLFTPPLSRATTPFSPFHLNADRKESTGKGSRGGQDGLRGLFWEKMVVLILDVWVVRIRGMVEEEGSGWLIDIRISASDDNVFSAGRVCPWYLDMGEGFV